MDSELERLRAENKKLKEQLQKTGVLLLDLFRYEQQPLLIGSKGFVDMLILSHTDPEYAQLKDDTQEYLEIVRQYLVRLEVLRDFGANLGFLATMYQSDRFTRLADLTTLIKSMQESRSIVDEGMKHTQVFYELNHAQSQYCLAIPILNICLCLSYLANFLLEIEVEKTVLNISATKLELLIKFQASIETDQVSKDKMYQLDKLSEGQLPYLITKFINLIGGKTTVEFDKSRLVIQISLPLVELGNTDEK